MGLTSYGFLIRRQSDLKKYFDEIRKRPFPQTQTKESLDEFLGIMMKKVFYFSGFGKSLQYQDLDAVKKSFRRLFIQMENEGQGPPFTWTIVYGGDHRDMSRPDIGSLVAWLKDEFGVQVLAAQNDVDLRDWGGMDGQFPFLHVDAVYWILTQDQQGLSSLLKVLTDRQMLTSLVVVGGGKIALAETQYVMKRGGKVIYIQAEAKNVAEGEHELDHYRRAMLEQLGLIEASFSSQGTPMVKCLWDFIFHGYIKLP